MPQVFLGERGWLLCVHVYWFITFFCVEFL